MSGLNKLVTRLGAAILSVEDFQSLLQEATEEIAAAVPADFVSVQLEQGGSRWEWRFDRTGRVPATFAPRPAARLAETAGRPAQVLAVGMPGTQGFADAGLRCGVITPVSLGKTDGLTLFVGFAEPGHILQNGELDAVESLAMLLAVGASRHAFQQMAVNDPWTGLYNRRFLETALPGELERALRYRQHFALLALDIDHFKEINDRHGHPMGDRVLAALAGAIKDSIRSCDAAVRIGGDEFLVLLPGTTASGARRIGRRLLDRIRALRFGDARDSFGVTVSGGVALANAHATAESIQAEADRALYEAKRGGRDAIRFPEATPLIDESAVFELRARRRQVTAAL